RSAGVPGRSVRQPARLRARLHDRRPPVRGRWTLERSRGRVRTSGRCRRRFRAGNPAAAAGRLRARRRNGSRRKIPRTCDRALPRHHARSGVDRSLPEARGRTRRHRIPDGPTAPAAVGARNDGADRRDHVARRGRSARKLPDPARSHPQAAGRPRHVPLQPLRFRRQGASLAVPQLQELGDGASDPQRRFRVTMGVAYGTAIIVALGIIAGCALLLSLALTGAALAYARRRGLLDQPGKRRSHTQPTPRGGGIGIVAAMVLAGISAWCLLDRSLSWTQPAALAAAVLAVALIGWRDDHKPLPVLPRLLVHAGAGLLVGLAALAPWAAREPALWWI